MTRFLSRLICVCALVLPALPVSAHEVRPAYLQITQIDPETCDVLFKVPAAGDNLRFGLYLRLPDDVERIGPPRGEFAGRAHVERLRIRRPGGLAGSVIEVEGLSGTLTDVLVRIERTDGTERTLRLSPGNPAFRFEVAHGGGRIATTYLGLGVEHILLGFDHLLFVLALVILVEGRRRLLWTITAFTLAHSLTLAAVTLGWMAWPPSPLEAIIALSIAFVAAEIVQARQGRPGLGWRQPWLLALAFGLLHGMGFAGALADIGVPEGQVPLALLAFNLGVEAGQLMFVGAVLLLALLWRRARLPLPAWWAQATAYGIGAMAVFWVWERVAAF